jgi:hypothetical protein
MAPATQSANAIRKPAAGGGLLGRPAMAGKVYPVRRLCYFLGKRGNARRGKKR